MTELSRTLQPPPGRRGFKIPEQGQTLPLFYLGWGARRFGEAPVSLSLNSGWIYAVVTEGSPFLLVPGERLRCTAGSAFLIGSECAMGWEDAARASSQVLIWIWKDGPVIDAIRPAVDSWKQWQISAAKLAGIEHNHKECRRELAAPDDATVHALTGLQCLLDVEWHRAVSGRAAASQAASRYETALNWIRYHLNATQPVREMAVYLGVSETTLQRIFRKHTGRGPLAVFQSLKLEAAERLLEEGQPVKEVAFKLGYQHPGDFTRFYSKATGHPPSRS